MADPVRSFLNRLFRLSPSSSHEPLPHHLPPPPSPPSPPCLTSSVWLSRLALQQNSKKKTRDGGEETSAGLFKYLVLVSSIRPHAHPCNVKWCSSETSSDTLLYYTVCFSVCVFMSVCVSAAAVWALREDVHPKATLQQLPRREERKELMPNIKTHTYTHRHTAAWLC